MRINSLLVLNFRAVTALELRDLKDVVIVAGPNGCGKSCIFDAIRLLKSTYGGYQPNEWQSWYGEFQINLARQDDILSILQNRSKPLEIQAEIQLAAKELAYVRDNAKHLLENQFWNEVAPELGM